MPSQDVKNSLTADNTNQISAYNYLVFFSMLCMSIMICNAIFTNRYISLTENIFVLGGTLTSPLFFILCDIIAEIFGYKVTKRLIWSGFICLTLFALACKLIIYAPSPKFFKSMQPYIFIFNDLLYIDLSSFIAFFISGLVNAHIITQWKILLRGKFFWLRSLGASTIAEGLYSAIAIMLMEIKLIPLNNIFQLILISYTIKIIYSIAFSIPGNVLVSYIKRATKIDIYDYQRSFNPFKKIKVKAEHNSCKPI